MFRICRILDDYHTLNSSKYVVEKATEMWLPVSMISLVEVHDGMFFVTVPAQVLACSIAIPFRQPYVRVEAHTDSHEDLRRFMTHQGNPLWDVLHELRYNPQFGSQLEALKNHFTGLQQTE